MVESCVDVLLEYWETKWLPIMLWRFVFYLQTSTFSKWAMLESNQRPPPCKFGQSFPGGFCPVGKSRLDKQFLPFLAL